MVHCFKCRSHIRQRTGFWLDIYRKVGGLYVVECCVYELTFPKGKGYIGVTFDIEKRMHAHMNGKSLIGSACRKHGKPDIKILLIGEREYCYEMEDLLIRHKKTISPSGYNLMTGGLKGSRHNKSTCMKMSASQTGRKHSEETKKKLKLARSKLVLPVKDTSIEVKVQNYLKLLHIEFFTHQYMHINHGYQCDVYIPSIKTIIECDGCYWHFCPECNKEKEITKKQEEQIERDRIRTKELEEKGFKVVRLWELEIRKMGINKFRKVVNE